MILLFKPQISDMSVRNHIEDLAKNVRSSSSHDQMTLLSESFQPGPVDVICARGKRAFNHTGNRRFRALIEAHLESYKKASSKIEKSLIVSSIVDSVREASPEGGFVKEDSGRWYEVGDHNAREKIGQSFRDLLHYKYKSSTKAKKQRRKQRESQSASTVNLGSHVAAAAAQVQTNKMAVQTDAKAYAVKSMGGFNDTHPSYPPKVFASQIFSGVDTSLQESKMSGRYDLEPAYVPSLPFSSMHTIAPAMNTTPVPSYSLHNAWQARNGSGHAVTRAIFDDPLLLDGQLVRQGQQGQAQQRRPAAEEGNESPVGDLSSTSFHSV